MRSGGEVEEHSVGRGGFVRENIARDFGIARGWLDPRKVVIRCFWRDNTALGKR